MSLKTLESRDITEKAAALISREDLVLTCLLLGAGLGRPLTFPDLEPWSARTGLPSRTEHQAHMVLGGLKGTGGPVCVHSPLIYSDRVWEQRRDGRDGGEGRTVSGKSLLPKSSYLLPRLTTSRQHWLRETEGPHTQALSARGRPVCRGQDSPQQAPHQRQITTQTLLLNQKVPPRQTWDRGDPGSSMPASVSAGGLALSRLLCQCGGTVFISKQCILKIFHCLGL